MKLQLVDNALAKLKAASVWVGTMWGALLAAMMANPSLISNAIPDELKEMLPPWARFFIVLITVFATIYAARVVRQPSVTGQQ